MSFGAFHPKRATETSKLLIRWNLPKIPTAMKVTTPGISWHNQERVSSVDFQPIPWPEPKSGADSQRARRRLASVGEDQHVVIWDVDVSVDGKIALNCLCDLSRHQNSVNIVRWSHDGKILASGDTDSAIFLWHYQDKDSPPDLFGDGLEALPVGNGEDISTAIPNENWTVLRTLRGHLQDVQGLDFSPCGSFLVSCSTDNTAIIYDVKKGTKLKILSEHKGWVNGVAWDPLNKFVASISSDRVLRLFKTKSFKPAVKTYKCKLLVGSTESGHPEERSVRLFHDDTFQSFYRRLAFSPDGEILVVPSGVWEMDGEAKTANCTYIFSRTNFSRPVMHLPNKEFSVAARFSPIKYKLRSIPPLRGEELPQAKEEETEKKLWEKTNTLFCLPYRMVYAVATQNTVTFYDTQQAEPFARVSKIHYIGLTDLTWSPDGAILTVSSSDGFCSLITFKEGEIGDIYSDDKNVKNSDESMKSTEERVKMEAEGEKGEAESEKIIDVGSTLIAVRK